MDWIGVYLMAVNGFAFVVTGIDKGLAVLQKSRISEKKLLALALAGGTLGTGLALVFFRHKMAKTRFLLVYFGILVIQIIAFLFYINSSILPFPGGGNFF